MNHFRTILGTILVLALLQAVLAPCAAADPTPLEQLTPKERAYLEKKVEGWADLPDTKKEQYARNVLRLRSLTPEQRALLAERIEELEERRARGAGPRRGRHPPRDWREMHRHLEAQGRLMHLIGSELWASLSKESRQAIHRALGRDGRRLVDDWFFRAVVQKLAEARADAGEYDVKPSEKMPDPVRRRIEQLRSKASEGDRGAQVHLARMAVSHDIRTRIEPYMKDGRLDEEGLRQEGREFVEQRPELLASVKARLEKASGDPEALKALVRPKGRRGMGFGSRGGMGDPRQLFRDLKEIREAMDEFEQALDDFAPHAAEDPELAARIERLKKALRRLRKLDPGRGRPGGRRGPGARPGGNRRRPGDAPPDTPEDDPPK